MPATNLTATDIARRLFGTRQLDHLVRMAPALEAILATKMAQGTLLDVGSGSRGIAPLLPTGWRVTSLDSDFEDYGAVAPPAGSDGSRVLGDVRALSFADGAFDVVIAIDLLEHIRPSDRAKAIAEICRVARRRAVLACPAGNEAAVSDRRLVSRLQKSGRRIPPWLTEHLENGFPEPGDLEAAALPFGTLEISANESVTAHERLVRAELSPISGVSLRLICRPLERLLTSRRDRARRAAMSVLTHLRGGDRPPTYRTMIVVDISSEENAQAGRQSSE